jgi:membrane associated rhomboid family serine protease
MGFADRDYAREPESGIGYQGPGGPRRPGGFGGGGGPGGPRGFGGGGGLFGGGRLPLFTKWLLIINVAVFVVDRVLARMFLEHIPGVRPDYILETWGYFSADTAILQGQVWRFITMQFLHFDGWHVFMNMLAVFFFGPMVERHFGSKRFLAFYLLCGAAGAVCYLLLWLIGVVVGDPSVHMLGASAGVFGILVAAAKFAPDTKVLLMFIIPIPLKVLVWFWIGVEVYNVLAMGHTQNSNAGGSAGHLGGAAVGILLVMRPRLLDWADSISDWGKHQFKRKVKQKQQRREQSLDDQVDKILDKVREHGLQSLSEREKQILTRSTHEKRGS